MPSSLFGFTLRAVCQAQDSEVSTMMAKKRETIARLETRQQELRRTVSRTQADGRSADEDTAQDTLNVPRVPTRILQPEQQPRVRL